MQLVMDTWHVAPVTTSPMLRRPARPATDLAIRMPGAVSATEPATGNRVAVAMPRATDTGRVLAMPLFIINRPHLF